MLDKEDIQHAQSSESPGTELKTTTLRSLIIMVVGGGLLCYMHFFFHMYSQLCRQYVICGITHICLVSHVLAFLFSYLLSVL